MTPRSRPARLVRPATLLALLTIASGCTATDAEPSRASPLPTATASVRVPTATSTVHVGTGSVESGQHQIVRTADDHVWFVAVDADGGAGQDPPFPNVRVRAYRAAGSGIPQGFREVDVAHEPRSKPGFPMSGVDVAVDRTGMVHVVYYRQSDDRCVHQLINPRTQRWGTIEASVPGGKTQGSIGWYGGGGTVVCSLALLGGRTPVIVVAGDRGTQAWRRTSKGWRREATLATAQAMHPSILGDRHGRIQVTWLQTDDTILWAIRGVSGRWSKPSVIASGHPLVMSNSNDDQAPSIAVDASDQPVVVWIAGRPGDPDERLELAVRRVDGSWARRDPDVFTHAPTVYARGDDLIALLGHDDRIRPSWMLRTAHASGWGPVNEFSGTGQWDGGATVRFDPVHDPAPDVVDVGFFDENSDTRPGFKPDLFYAAIRLPHR